MEKLTKLANKIGGLDKGTEFGEGHSYTEFYQDYFEKIRKKAKAENRKVYILEVGIWQGSSLRLYNEFFGKDNCEIYGLDCDFSYNVYHEDNVYLLYTNQDSIEELNKTANEFKDIKFDIIIDDGGHRVNQQFNTLLAYHSFVKEDGIYIIEDLHLNLFGDWGKYTDSPLFYLTTKQKPGILSLEQYLELNDCINSITIFKLHNNRCRFNQQSITSLLTLNKK